MDSERDRLVDATSGGVDNINKTDVDRPSEYVAPTHTPSTAGEARRKKVFVIGGIGILVFIIALTVTLVLVLKKGDDPVTPPVDPTVHYNPYQVLESKPDEMYYKIGRNT